MAVAIVNAWRWSASPGQPNPTELESHRASNSQASMRILKDFNPMLHEAALVRGVFLPFPLSSLLEASPRYAYYLSTGGQRRPPAAFSMLTTLLRPLSSSRCVMPSLLLGVSVVSCASANRGQGHDFGKFACLGSMARGCSNKSLDSHALELNQEQKQISATWKLCAAVTPALKTWLWHGINMKCVRSCTGFSTSVC